MGGVGVGLRPRSGGSSRVGGGKGGLHDGTAVETRERREERRSARELRRKLGGHQLELGVGRDLTFQTRSSFHQSFSPILDLHREKKRRNHVDRTRREEGRAVGSCGCKVKGSSRVARKG